MQDKLFNAFDRAWTFIVKHKKVSIGVGVALIVILIWYTISNYLTYTDYTIKNDVTMEDSEGTAYESFHDNIVKYNSIVSE